MGVPAGILYFGPSALRSCGVRRVWNVRRFKTKQMRGFFAALRMTTGNKVRDDNREQVRDDNQKQVGGYGRDWPRDWRADLMPRAAALAGSILRAAATSVAESESWLACRSRRARTR